MNVVQPLRGTTQGILHQALQKLGRMNRDINALEVALEDITTSLYWTHFGDAWRVLKQTFKQGGEGSFMSSNLKDMKKICRCS